jgi:hypothetical protein
LDPGSGIEKFGFGINIPEPQHWLVARRGGGGGVCWHGRTIVGRQLIRAYINYKFANSRDTLLSSYPYPLEAPGQGLLGPEAEHACVDEGSFHEVRIRPHQFPKYRLQFKIIF